MHLSASALGVVYSLRLLKTSLPSKMPLTSWETHNLVTPKADQSVWCLSRGPTKEGTIVPVLQDPSWLSSHSLEAPRPCLGEPVCQEKKGTGSPFTKPEMTTHSSPLSSNGGGGRAPLPFVGGSFWKLVDRAPLALSLGQEREPHSPSRNRTFP